MKLKRESGRVGWAGWLIAAPAITQAIFAPIWGMVGDRFGRKPMVLRAMFGISVATLAMSLARTPYQLLAIRLVEGALSGTITANMALVATVTPREQTGYAMGTLQASSQAGHMVGPLVGGLVADHFGYRVSFFIGALIVFIAGMMIQLFTKEAPRLTPLKRASVRWASLSFITVGFVVCLATLFQMGFALNIAMPLFPLFIRSLHGTGNVASITGGILTATAVAATIATSFLGRLSDSWGHKRMLISCAFAMAIITLLHAVAINVWHLATLRCLLGFATAGLRPSVMALMRHSVPSDDIGKALGVSESFRCIGQILGPLFGGYIAAEFAGLTGFRVAFLTAGGALMLIPLITGLLLRARPSTVKSDTHTSQ